MNELKMILAKFEAMGLNIESIKIEFNFESDLELVRAFKNALLNASDTTYNHLRSSGCINSINFEEDEYLEDEIDLVELMSGQKLINPADGNRSTKCYAYSHDR